VLKHTREVCTDGVQNRPPIPHPPQNPHKRRFGLATATEEDSTVVLFAVRRLSKHVGFAQLPEVLTPRCICQPQRVVGPHCSSSRWSCSGQHEPASDRTATRVFVSLHRPPPLLGRATCSTGLICGLIPFFCSLTLPFTHRCPPCPIFLHFWHRRPAGTWQRWTS